MTDDGSHSLKRSDINEIYHSRFGAVTESMHIYIKAGYNKIKNNRNPINILEVGFGTGLNALLTFLDSSIENRMTNYIAYEPYPIEENIYHLLNYSGVLNLKNEDTFRVFHTLSWNTRHQVSPEFTFSKWKEKIEDSILPDNFYNLVYFDAFAPDIQPALWNEIVFSKIRKAMVKGGLLLTYSTKGIVKRNLKEAGFIIEKLPGPPGKREIIRATAI